MVWIACAAGTASGAGRVGAVDGALAVGCVRSVRARGVVDAVDAVGPIDISSAPRSPAERSKGPSRQSKGRAKRWHAPLPSGCAEERRRRRDQGRSCLSEASSADPLLRRAPQVARSEAKGSQTVGSPFLCLLSFGEAKESRSPAGARPGSGKQIHDGRKDDSNRLLLNLNPPGTPPTQPIKRQINNRRSEKGKQLTDDQPPEDRQPQRPPQFSPIPEAEH